MSAPRPDEALPVLSRARPAARAGGFSLLEVMVASAILTVLTLSTLMVVIPVSRQVRIHREVELATVETGKVLEKIQSTPFFQITTIYPQGINLDVPGLENGRITVTYDDPAADPLFVRATLSWDSPDPGAMTRTFSTVRTE